MKMKKKLTLIIAVCLVFAAVIVIVKNAPADAKPANAAVNSPSAALAAGNITRKQASGIASVSASSEGVSSSSGAAPSAASTSEGGPSTSQPGNIASVSLTANDHYTAQEMANLQAIIQSEAGTTADDDTLLSNYGANECRGYAVGVIDRAYGILDETPFNEDKYTITSPNYQEVAQLTDQGSGVTATEVENFFTRLYPGDVLQMKLEGMWHSAFFLGMNETGAVWFDCNWDMDTNYDGIQVHTIRFSDLAGDLSASGCGITGYWILS